MEQGIPRSTCIQLVPRSFGKKTAGTSYRSRLYVIRHQTGVGSSGALSHYEDYLSIKGSTKMIDRFKKHYVLHNHPSVCTDGSMAFAQHAESGEYDAA
jgi:hypothetical protein